MLFKEFKKLLIKDIKNNKNLSTKMKSELIFPLVNKKKTHNNINHNICTDFLLKLYHSKQITFDEYSKFYFDLDNYF